MASEFVVGQKVRRVRGTASAGDVVKLGDVVTVRPTPVGLEDYLPDVAPFWSEEGNGGWLRSSEFEPEPAELWEVGRTVELVPERRFDTEIDKDGLRSPLHANGGEIRLINENGHVLINTGPAGDLWIHVWDRRFYRLVPQPDPVEAHAAVIEASERYQAAAAPTEEPAAAFDPSNMAFQPAHEDGKHHLMRIGRGCDCEACSAPVTVLLPRFVAEFYTRSAGAFGDMGSVVARACAEALGTTGTPEQPPC